MLVFNTHWNVLKRGAVWRKPAERKTSGKRSQRVTKKKHGKRTGAIVALCLQSSWCLCSVSSVVSLSTAYKIYNHIRKFVFAETRKSESRQEIRKLGQRVRLLWGRDSVCACVCVWRPLLSWGPDCYDKKITGCVRDIRIAAGPSICNIILGQSKAIKKKKKKWQRYSTTVV